MILEKALKAYNFYKSGKKAYTYGKLVKQSVDDSTRPGALAILGIKGMIEIAGKVMGSSLSGHPYFTYHKAHLEALAQALNASSNFDGAQKALNAAIRSADAADALTKTLTSYVSRKNGLKLTYSTMIAGELQLAADTSPEGEQERQIVKQTREQLGSSAEQHLYEWRINACDLTYDCLQLLAMAEVELQSTKAAMKKFDEKMKALKSGGGIGKILGYQSEQLRQLQQLDRMTNPSGPDAAAVEDPTAYAQSRVDQIDAAHSLFAQFCDLAMSDEAYDPDKFRLHSAKL